MTIVLYNPEVNGLLRMLTLSRVLPAIALLLRLNRSVYKRAHTCTFCFSIYCLMSFVIIKCQTASLKAVSSVVWAVCYSLQIEDRASHVANYYTTCAGVCCIHYMHFLHVCGGWYCYFRWRPRAFEPPS